MQKLSELLRSGGIVFICGMKWLMDCQITVDAFFFALQKCPAVRQHEDIVCARCQQTTTGFGFVDTSSVQRET